MLPISSFFFALKYTKKMSFHGLFFFLNTIEIPLNYGLDGKKMLRVIELKEIFF